MVFQWLWEVSEYLIGAGQEKRTLIPASQRLLFCALFRECRLFTRSLKT